ncbi:TetR/AcrR family transcriptional regulator [Caldibacillus thermolactis]|uniref:TetR/AcrR family transcriptional regulator n=1 Tax=Pallidibacillus thermolactis TaxID=251051 RepID=A0ABT2WAW8_9BACI|nr:TetR/AcrR family transcriptional regulator [Pallidibacillus thermolactis]MCU9592839.1 TetR/AcrR family transcriptional regulator [Pallidibacillus thermolactis]MED1674226.1 TetR/AcrR family transcriptional regulator [Pallidibacillus thermolactis subsp. kokeshiiformis]
MNGFQKRTEAKKKQIIQATLQLLKAKGDEKNITMEEIAKQANVAKTTIFKYFGNKDNLIREVYQSFFEEMIESAKAILAKNKPFEETLIELSQNKIKYFHDMGYTIYVGMMKYITEKEDDGLSLMAKKLSIENQSILLDLFHRGKKEGKVDLKYSDEFLMLYFRTIVEGMSNPQIYEKIAPYTEEWTEMLMKGLAPDKK